MVLPTIMCMTKAECQILVLNDDPEAKQLLAKFEVVTPPTNQVFITGPDGEAKVEIAWVEGWQVEVGSKWVFNQCLFFPSLSLFLFLSGHRY